MTVGKGENLNLRAPIPERELRGGTAQEQLWNAIRTLKTFTTIEAAVTASTDTVKVSEATAAAYLRHLRDAGYLMIRRDAVARTDQWRLIPRMNTGPKPPMLIQISVVFDRNRRDVTDGPHSAEVVL